MRGDAAPANQSPNTSTMNRATIFFATAALASLVACNDYESHAASNPVTPPPVVVPERTPTPTLADRAEELYHEAVDTTQSKLKDARESLAEIERKIDEKGDQAPEAWRQMRADLKTKLDAADAKLDGWKTAARENWDSFKTEMSTMVDDLSRALEDAKKQIVG
jgi:ElaB/YqjD/DUF883 family membrane-anchored ribosome-binding protein